MNPISRYYLLPTNLLLLVKLHLPLTGKSSNVVTSESDQYIVEISISSPLLDVNEEVGYIKLYQREVSEYEQFTFVGQKRHIFFY